MINNHLIIFMGLLVLSLGIPSLSNANGEEMYCGRTIDSFDNVITGTEGDDKGNDKDDLENDFDSNNTSDDQLELDDDKSLLL